MNNKIFLIVLLILGGWFSQGMALTEDEIDALIYQTQDAIVVGKYEEAVSHANKVLEAREDMTEVLALRAEAKYYTKDIPGARQDAKEVIGLIPDLIEAEPAYYILALIAFHDESDDNQAIEYINKAIELTTDDPLIEHYQLRASIFKKLGKTDLAQVDLNIVDELSKKFKKE